MYGNLRIAILSGKIVPGTRLVESTLASEMGVSRTPIREALHKLDLENLVYSIPKVGYIVIDISERDFDDLLSVRAAIEQIAARWAIERITPEEIGRLEKNVKKMGEAIGKGSTRRVIDIDMEFDEIIYKASRSKRLCQIGDLLRDHMLKFRKAALRIPEVASKANEGHYKIFQAIKSKNPKKVEDAIAFHMAESKKGFLLIFRNGHYLN